MPVDLKSLEEGTATCNIEFQKQDMDVEYRPHLLTGKRLSIVDDPEEVRKNPNVFFEFFVEVIKSWDVRKGTKKVPLTVEGVMEVPMPLLRKVFMGVMMDAGGDTGEASSNSGGTS